MAAPIQRYSDPRLYGTTLVKPFNTSYEWIRSVANPLHPKCSLITECAVRAIKVLTGILAIAMTSLPALIGHVIQINHYHSMSVHSRLHPPKVSVDGMHLPPLKSCKIPGGTAYHGTDEDGAIGILRWGFNPGKTKVGAKMAEAVYISVADQVSATYGRYQLVLTLDLKEGEIAYIDDATLNKWREGKNLSDKKVMAAVRELYYLNGYRAIKYDLNHYGTEEAWAVYDPLCISIQKITTSPRAVAMAHS